MQAPTPRFVYPCSLTSEPHAPRFCDGLVASTMPIVSSSLTCLSLHQIINLISTPFWNIITFYYISCDLKHSPGSENKCRRAEEADQQLIWRSASTNPRTNVRRNLAACSHILCRSVFGTPLQIYFKSAQDPLFLELKQTSSNLTKKVE